MRSDMELWQMLAIVLGIFLFALFVVSIGAMLYLKRYQKLLEKKYPSRKITFGGEKKSRVLILFQPSRHGTGEYFSRTCAETIQENGYTAVVDYISAYSEYKVSEYEVMILCSPVYMGRVSPYIEECLRYETLQGKRILLLESGLIEDDPIEMERLGKIVPKGNKVFCWKAAPTDVESVRKVSARIVRELE